MSSHSAAGPPRQRGGRRPAGRCDALRGLAGRRPAGPPARADRRLHRSACDADPDRVWDYLCLTEAADIDAVHARALAAGATGVWEPATTEWGSYRCRVLDPEGFEWSFGTHRPGEPRDDWSEGKRDDTGDDRTRD